MSTVERFTRYLETEQGITPFELERVRSLPNPVDPQQTTSQSSENKAAPAPVSSRIADDDDQWRLYANCRGADPEIFFPDPKNSQNTLEVAREICRVCIVKVTCLEYALEANEKGVWGGTSERERRRKLVSRRGAGN